MIIKLLRQTAAAILIPESSVWLGAAAAGKGPDTFPGVHPVGKKAESR